MRLVTLFVFFSPNKQICEDECIQTMLAYCQKHNAESGNAAVLHQIVDQTGTTPAESGNAAVHQTGGTTPADPMFIAGYESGYAEAVSQMAEFLSQMRFGR